MTQEETKEAIKVMSAYANGKKIQYLDDDGRWVDTPNPVFDWSRWEYRVKPESKYRPFKDKGECWQEMHKHQPFGYLTYKEYNSITCITEIYTANINKGLYFRLSRSSRSYDASDLFKCYNFADGEPFGIKEE